MAFGNLHLFAKCFQVMDWWHERRTEFPNLHLIACMILPLPEHNGFQERAFSSCTWFDKKLSQRTLSANCEMKVLLHLNRKLLDAHRRRQRKHRDVTNIQAAKRAAERILEQAKKSRADLASMKVSDWNEMVAAQLEMEENEGAATTTAGSTTEGSDCETAPETSSDEESDVSDHELMVAAGFENAAQAEVADEEYAAVFS